ncbi:MAG: MFS transporter [Spirochaetaceae bacterium]|jgi:GPH family glycoside/pentoside/hexuronide:cation symporter|nr:MFS transporter [Spirochaetaceae bacterium]
MAAKKLSMAQKLGFGVFDLGGNLFFTVIGFWSLNYLTDVVGLAAWWAGFAIMIGKVWDAVTDPLMGYVSDRTRSPWGRRRPYLLFGALPMALAMWFFFTSPSTSNPVLLVIWAAGALVLLNTAGTIINIPYSSLTPELSGDYHERTSLNGYRFGFAVFGTLIGAAAVQPIVERFPGRRAGFSALGAMLGGLIMVTTLITFFGTREKRHSSADYPVEGFFATYGAVFRNRPFVFLLLTYALHIMGITFLQGILVYYVKYMYGREDLAYAAMGLLLLVAMIFIPVSVLVSKYIGKKKTYQICFGILVLCCMLIFFLGHDLGTRFFMGLMVLAGIGVGFSYVAPFAMVPDAIEFDAAASGERKEGAYYGIWTFVSKLGTALAFSLSGLVLGLGAYSAGAVQGAGSLLAIRIIIGPLPALALCGAFFMVRFYPIDEKTYRRLVLSNHDT